MFRPSLLCVLAQVLLFCAADSTPESLQSPDSPESPESPESLKSPESLLSPKSPESPEDAEVRKSSKTRENQLESDILHHFQHLTYVAEFVCREPQARVMPVERLLPSSVTWGKAYYPDVTVVHLCENSGTCTSGYRCGPSHVNSVHLPFKVTYLEDVENHKKGSWSMEFHLLENHTNCACAEEPVSERPRPVSLNNQSPNPPPPPPTPPVRPPTPNYNPSFNPSFNNPNINPSAIRPPIPPTLNNVPSSPRI